jgi:multidrug resistance protein
VIWTTVALDLVGFGIVVPILGRYAERFGAGGVEVGLLFASFSLAQFVFAPLLGRLSDRIGRKPVLLMSLFGTAAASFLTAGAGVLWLLFVARILDGASGASVAVAQGAVTDMVPEEQRPHALGMIGAAFGVGFVVGPVLGGLSSLGGPHIPFYVAGGLALLNALVAIRRVPETRPLEHRRQHPIRDARANRLWGLALATFVAVCAFAGFEATFALLSKERFDLTEAGVATVFIGVGVVLTLVQGVLVRRLSKRVGPDRMLELGLLLNGAGLLVLAAAENWTLLVISLVLLTVGQGLVSPSLTLAVTRRVPEHQRGEALGFQQGVSALARVGGPALAGVLFEHVAIPAPYIVGAALCSVGFVVVIGQRRPVSPGGNPTVDAAVTH